MGDFFIDINPKNRETLQFEYTLLYKKLGLDENNYNLNIPRYVDTSEEEEKLDL